jgi:hypothetical protein
MQAEAIIPRQRGTRLWLGSIPEWKPPCLAIPSLYRLWQATGRRARLERLLLRWTGPFSRPLKWSSEFKKDYDLRDCSVIDQIGGPGWGFPEPDGTCFWSDRADVRLLVPLSAVEDHMVVLGLSDRRLDSPNFTLDVFANGYFMTTVDLRRDAATSRYCFFISRQILTDRWVELSLRPRSYQGQDPILPETYWFTRGVPVASLQVYDIEQANCALSQHDVPRLSLRVLAGSEPESSKFKRIKEAIERSTYKNSAALPNGFDPVAYVFLYPDLFEAEVDPYEHFLDCGRHEGRRWR